MKIESKPIAEHHEVPLADDGRLEDVITHWQQRKPLNPDNRIEDHCRVRRHGRIPNRCYVVSVDYSDDLYPEGKLAEILSLVEAQGDHIVGQEITQHYDEHPKTYLSLGISAEIAERAKELGADMLVLDAELTPSQTRNLENSMGIPICDREAVILNVFLNHAKTRSARNQVEIAQLEYLRPRIRGLGLNMDQQAGGIMRGRGPGETASEMLARQLDSRLAQLNKYSKKLSKSGVCQRNLRSSCKRITLVGYTNAGKTSLMNALTTTRLSARNLPFETLDTTTRALSRETDGDVLISDTVGFIRALPKRLLASFESTLAEIVETDLLVIVVDASNPERQLHLRTTEKLLVKLKADGIPRLYLFNKSDKLDAPLSAEHCNALSRGYTYKSISSHNKDDIAHLRRELIQKARGKLPISNLFVPYIAKQIISKIYAKCRVIEAISDDHGLNFTLEAEANLLAQLQSDSAEMQR